MPSELDPRPYKLYRSRPQGMLDRLRGEEDLAGLPGEPSREGPRRTFRRGRLRISPRRVLAYLVLACVAWLLLSLVLFMVSTAQQQSIPADAQAALTSGPNMLTSTDTVLILGTDQRPKGSKEPGAFSSGIRSDTIMLWRVGGGVSRRLSIPRDTLAQIPGHGVSKINAAYAYGGPALAIRTVEAFTGVKINHIIIVNLAAFPPFIDAIGGVDVKTGRVCSDISGGAKNGGWSLYLRPGVHHLSGIQALVYARTRENKCNPSDNDLTRVRHQQEILNAIKSKLLSVGTFFRLPWASWEAPKVLRTDMGGPTLLTLFAASELGGSAPVQVLPTNFSSGGTALTASPGAIRSAVNKLMNG
ncbi:MAG TPA: LCP family protein [Solirubrobacteraceae bacterium]|nr:LCP family protein [Solirubrobacteraceae bacterium]